MYTIRPAGSLDIEPLYAIDPVAQCDRLRREFITRSVAMGCCVVIVTPDDQPVGYGVIDYAFYDQGFISMVYVSPAHRGHGAATQLLCHLECLCRTPKLFTSTNLSNQAMQALLAKLGYHLSGVLQDLDEGDPELVYVKRLKTDGDRLPVKDR